MSSQEENLSTSSGDNLSMENTHKNSSEETMSPEGEGAQVAAGVDQRDSEIDQVASSPPPYSFEQPCSSSMFLGGAGAGGRQTPAKHVAVEIACQMIYQIGDYMLALRQQIAKFRENQNCGLEGQGNDGIDGGGYDFEPVTLEMVQEQAKRRKINMEEMMMSAVEEERRAAMNESVENEDVMATVSGEEQVDTQETSVSHPFGYKANQEEGQGN